MFRALFGSGGHRDARRESLAPMLSDLRLRERDGALRIRRAGDEDAGALARLAALDSAAVPEGELLIAELDGEPVAAAPLSGGPAIADPFRYTAEIVGLLELRASQMALASRGLGVAGAAGAALPRRA
jgi:hypothetical protein